VPLLPTALSLHENFDILQMVNRRAFCAVAALLASKPRVRERSRASTGDRVVPVLLIKPCASARWRPKWFLVAAGL
jgi:hypothetical protein